MDRNELTLAITAALAGAVLLGWLLGWIFARLNGPAGPRSMKGTADLAARLHAAEEAAAQAQMQLATREAELGARLAQLKRDLELADQQLVREQARTEEIREAYRTAMSGFTRNG